LTKLFYNNSIGIFKTNKDSISHICSFYQFVKKSSNA